MRVTFDCYGTLIDWDAGAKAYLSGLMARHGVSRPIEKVLARWERIQFELIQGPYRPYREILAQSAVLLMKEFTVCIAAPDAADFADAMKTWEPFADAGPALRRLARRATLGIISNTDPDILEASVRRIDAPFDACVTAADARAYKPDPRVFATAVRRMGGDVRRWTHVAFGFEYDLGPAREAGMRTVWLNRGGIARPADVRCDAEIRTLEELEGVV